MAGRGTVRTALRGRRLEHRVGCGAEPKKGPILHRVFDETIALFFTWLDPAKKIPPLAANCSEIIFSCAGISNTEFLSYRLLLLVSKVSLGDPAT